MSRNGDLLVQVAQQHHILKGDREADGEWKARLIYSICGMMAYASLWDDSADSTSDEVGHTVSVVHLKRRVSSVLAAYQALYPELAAILPANAELLADEIEQQFTIVLLEHGRNFWNLYSPEVKWIYIQNGGRSPPKHFLF